MPSSHFRTVSMILLALALIATGLFGTPYQVSGRETERLFPAEGRVLFQGWREVGVCRGISAEKVGGDGS